MGKRLTGCLTAAALTIVPTAALSGDNTRDNDPELLPDVRSLPDTALDRVRGGFLLTAAGIEISIEIQRTQRINDQLLATRRFDLTDQEAGPIHRIHQPPGTGNFPDTFPEGALTVLQNALDNQKIENLDVYNIRIEHISRYTSGAFGQFIDQHLADALR